ncbi:uncharacterized protein LOC127091714 [Lathyrus oleraceus]|uniref:uncharacterized protein LOC127091714 n=1 Tax=Pisum sativum TaxID=3888 RepID=UPI001FC5E440|nr:uncharacterized protein LOC127091714 [Pisum sativum]
MVAGWRDHGHRRFFGGEKRGSMSRPNLWWSAELTAARLWRGWGVTRRSHRSRREVDFRFSTVSESSNNWFAFWLNSAWIHDYQFNLRLILLYRDLYYGVYIRLERLC